MATEAAPLPHLFPSFSSPPLSRHHLAELRIESAHSAVAFSAPCAAARKKRRCLLPPSSPRKKVLLELHPFGALPPLSPTPSTPPRGGSPATAPPLLSSRAGTSSSPASDFSFPLAGAVAAGGSGSGGGGGGGNMFASSEDALTTPTGSCASGLSFLASPGRPETPMGSTASGGFAFVASPKQPTAPLGYSAGGGFSFLTLPKRPAVIAGPTANGGFAFPPEPPLTPTGSNANGGGASLSYEPSLSPKEWHSSRAIVPLPSPTRASTGSTDSTGFSFPSPGPSFGKAGSPGLAAAKQLAPTVGTDPSPSFVFSSWPAHKSSGGSKRRSRRNLRIATPRRGSTRPRDEQQPVTPPPQKVAKTAAGDASRSSILSESAGRPCCTFFTSSAKAAKQESKNSCSKASRSGATSPARPSSSVEKTITPEREVEVSSAEREAPRPSSPAAACTGVEVVVRVTCKCGVHKEFSFDHSH
ncbi:hypothetical protein E2562_028409 [Oryza meyeriana var. granulata]|uniref:Uncharacterized protein n=1 Tax=Oryza meyeriana var. granulata TaxID=110450 RepID=A0A6G1EQM2_9ORYZ|nr:hypothetical protein E2562_028409 [Oryza meyeriana var. granulata]